MLKEQLSTLIDNCAPFSEEDINSLARTNAEVAILLKHANDKISVQVDTFNTFVSLKAKESFREGFIACLNILDILEKKMNAAKESTDNDVREA